MAPVRCLRRWSFWVVLALLGLPVAAAAQVSPTAPAHPNLPWSLGVAIPQGQLIRYIFVPPQPITLQYLIPGAPENAPPATEPVPAGNTTPPADASEPASVPATPQVVQQVVTVPGYYVRETTAGFHYPDRWTIEQVAPNTYRWHPLPAQFVPK
jgi:hypothetical protein